MLGWSWGVDGWSPYIKSTQNNQSRITLTPMGMCLSRYHPAVTPCSQGPGKPSRAAAYHAANPVGSKLAQGVDAAGTLAHGILCILYITTPPPTAEIFIPQCKQFCSVLICMCFEVLQDTLQLLCSTNSFCNASRSLLSRGSLHNRESMKPSYQVWLPKSSKRRVLFGPHSFIETNKLTSPLVATHGGKALKAHDM